jgi:hypothetical protein
MAQEMRSEFVRAQLEKGLAVLASSAADQLKFLEREGVAPSADELALAEEGSLWHVDQLGSAPQWDEVRRLARAALQTLREPHAEA